MCSFYERPTVAKKKYHNGGGQISQGGRYANLPENVVMKDYPEYPCRGKEGYDDTMNGIDKNIKGGYAPGNKA